MRGIYGKGYGQVARAVMTDPHISIEAKGIYSYFCSYTGNGCNTAFPSVSKIVSDLNVTDTTYYKHFKTLTELGLITVEQANGGDGKGFKRNIYTIEDYPAPYIQFLKGSGAVELIIREESISAAGYGNVPKSVMTDSSISLSAKGLYAYLCAYAGASHSAIPSKDVTLYQLDISGASYNKYTKALETAGYITRSRKRDNGKMDKTVFLINRELPEESAPPCTKISRTIDSRTINSRAVDPCALNSRALDSHTQKSGTNKPRRKPKSDFYQSENLSILAPAREEAERVTDETDLLEEIVRNGTLPYECCYAPDKLETAVKLMTGGEYRMQAGIPVEERQLYCAFTDALCDMLRADTPPLRVKGSQLSHAKVYERLAPLIVAGHDSWGEPYAELPHLYESFAARYKSARQKSSIGSAQKYIPAVLWTEICSGALDESNQIAHDFADGGVTGK